ncbi:hypothetical protein C7T35_16830 [Variovorax sp. WS11]|nr:hypothetical protein C7T35_16830 [Variovorax sp. WS11]
MPRLGSLHAVQVRTDRVCPGALGSEKAQFLNYARASSNFLAQALGMCGLVDAAAKLTGDREGETGRFRGFHDDL